uniref:helix-turn-helix domain-containing protein n=1 Tax=Rhodoferax sp. GW822-FHT02A01 TaxID=3141537 RepID=UPI00406C9A34
MPYVRKVALFKVPVTVGDHIAKKRRELGETQKQFADRLGVTAATVLNWEKNLTKELPVRLVPKVTELLGYNPEPVPEGVGARLRHKRRSLGLSIEEVAIMQKVDRCTWETWEQKEDWPRWPRYRKMLEQFLKDESAG